MASTATISGSSLQPIHYFGYGPIVHPVVRHRRGVPIASVETAILYDHRLTFRWGGLVTVVPQRGYEVFGVLLRFDTLTAWEAFRTFDEGGYHIETLQVYSLKTDRQVTVKAFIMPEYDTSKLEKKQQQQQQQQLEMLPQERYLKLMADGMNQLGIDPDYIRDQILSVPYSAKAKSQNFRTFPFLSTGTKQISLPRYKRICQHARPTDVFFVLGGKVLLLDEHDPKNPCSMWIRSRFHGQPDMTLLLHMTVVDPDLTMVDEQKELTTEHYAWAENYMYEYLEQGGLSATIVWELTKNDGVETTTSRPWYCGGSWFLLDSHYRYQRNQQQRRNSNSTVSSDASSDIALHQISRTRRSRRIRCERSWNIGSHQDFTSSELFLLQNTIDANDTAAEETYHIDDDDQHRLDSSNSGGDNNDIQLIIPHVIVWHDMLDDAITATSPTY